MADNRTCETCRWWRADEAEVLESGTSECRRYPPIPIWRTFEIGEVTEDIMPYWPTTDSSDFCGEHAPKPETRRPDGYKMSLIPVYKTVQ
jgi:hypothetical protein